MAIQPPALANVLKNAKLLVFYFVFGPVSIASKRSLNHMIFHARSLIFRILPTFWLFLLGINLEVFFFYQQPSFFGFPPPVPQWVRSFSLIDPLFFFHHLPLVFGDFSPTTIPTITAIPITTSTHTLVGACVLEGGQL